MARKAHSPEKKPPDEPAIAPADAEAKLEHDLKRMALILGWMLIGTGALWAVVWLWPVFTWVLGTVSPFLIALVVAYVLNPIVLAVQHKMKLGRVGGIVAAASLFLVLLLVFFGLLLPILYTQAVHIFEAAQTIVPEILGSILRFFHIKNAAQVQKMAQDFIEQLDMSLREAMGKIVRLAPGVTQESARAFGGAMIAIGGFFSGIAGFVATFVLVVVIAFYYLAEFGAIPCLLRLVLPDGTEERTMEILGKVDVAVGGFLRGQLIVCGLVAACATVGLSLIGMYQYALLVGFLAGAANFIPYLGPVMGAAPALLWALLAQSHETWSERFLYAGLVVGLFALIQAIDGFFLQPHIVGKNSNLHPLAVLGALIVGGQFGFGAMILAVPLACIARVLIKEFWWDAHLASKLNERSKA